MRDIIFFGIAFPWILVAALLGWCGYKTAMWLMTESGLQRGAGHRPWLNMVCYFLCFCVCYLLPGGW
ncbi:DUF1656 domain-containing protein [Erwinia sp. JUb26]|uniref:DUF1656 domain-containing protein n=1 Tax=Erwinia sp. JUb26 TaxID=2485126 RepID=UPI000FAE351F|nr:uncharacterized protein DUF1656 [Erwinia sp. JUb26]